MYSGAPLQVGDSVPNFSCDSTLGVTTFHEVLDGQFSLLVTFPRNFEAVGTTEMGQIAKLKEEFEARNVKVFALSVDTKMNHRRWISDIEELQVSRIVLLAIYELSLAFPFGALACVFRSRFLFLCFVHGCSCLLLARHFSLLILILSSHSLFSFIHSLSSNVHVLFFFSPPLALLALLALLSFSARSNH